MIPLRNSVQVPRRRLFMFTVLVIGVIISLCTYVDGSSSSSSSSSSLSAAGASSSNGETVGKSNLRSGNINHAATTGTAGPRRDLIVGGTDAAQGRFPSFVALVNRDDKIDCGGTLIAPDVVMTAGHCKASNISYALIGKYWTDVTVTTDGHERIDVLNPITEMDPSIVELLEAEKEAIIDPTGFIHPSHNLEERSYDIMLMKLASPSSHPVMTVNFDPKFPVTTDTGNEIVVVGLGRTDVNGPKPTVLQQVYVNYIPYQECIDSAGFGVDYKFELLPDMICTFGKGFYGTRGQCFGDSGGPYIVPGDTYVDDIQVGIVSWAVNCANEVHPMVGSRTSESAKFIQAVTCAISPYASDSFCTAPLPVPQYVPVTNGVAVEVRIYSDPFPNEISWKITDVSGFDVYALASYGSSKKDYDVTTVMLSPGGSYMYTIMDAADDGIFGDVDATLYEVVLVDQSINWTLAEGNGAFTTSRSAMFTVPSSSEYSTLSTTNTGRTTNLLVDESLLVGQVTASVKIYILFADYHEDLSWMVTDSNDVNTVYATVPPDHYRYGRDVEEEIQLPSGTFNFTISDRRGTDDYRSFKAFSVSYIDADGGTVYVIEHLGTISSYSTTQTFEIPASALPEGSSSTWGGDRITDPTGTDLCLALYVQCDKPSDCCSGRCAGGQCRSHSRDRKRDSIRLGLASAGGAAARAATEPNK